MITSKTYSQRYEKNKLMPDSVLIFFEGEPYKLISLKFIEPTFKRQAEKKIIFLTSIEHFFSFRFIFFRKIAARIVMSHNFFWKKQLL